MPVVAALVVGWLAIDSAREEARVATARPAMRVDFPLPSFDLVERSGQGVTASTLAGRPWIAGFVFTRCQGPCPALTLKMRGLQDRLQHDGSDVRLVSVTVDPAHDTPAVLSAYAATVTADPARWLFVTGQPAAVVSLIRDGFHLGVEQKPDAGDKPGVPLAADFITHDTRLALVGADGHVKGYYDSDDAASLEQLARDAHRQSALAAPGRASSLPLVNASLNAVSALLLVLGYALIRRGHVAAHKACMLGAFGVSAVFLGCYLLHHARNGSTPFAGDGVPRDVYFAILVPHVILAILILPLEIATLWCGLKGRLARHVALARWTFPVWLYVSVTGVAVYLLLYRIYV